jgi:hypothetical protein
MGFGRGGVEERTDQVQGPNQFPWNVEGLAQWTAQAEEEIGAKAQMLRLGSPTGALQTIERTGFWREYGGTRIYWRAGRRAREVHGAILQRYLQEGGPEGWIGWPLSDEESAGTGHGRMSRFQAATLLWEPEKGVHEIHGPIRDEWLRIGGDQWGMPVTDELPTPDGAGAFNHFWHTGTEDRSIYYHPDLGAHPVEGEVRRIWSSMGWEQSYLGYPTNDTRLLPARFQFGTILLENGVFRVLPDSVRREFHLDDDGTWADIKFTFNADGHWYFEGDVRNDDRIGYNVAIGLGYVFADSNNTAKGGSVEVHIGPSITETAEEHFGKGGQDPWIQHNFGSLRDAQMVAKMEVGVGYADVVQLVFLGGVIVLAGIFITPFLTGDKCLGEGRDYGYTDAEGNTHAGRSWPIEDCHNR